MLFGIHWYYVALAIVVYFALGALWYSPVMFARPWREALGRANEPAASPTVSMFVTVLAMIVLVSIEAYFMTATGTNGLLRGGYLGLKLWAGFSLMTALINNVFQNGSKRLFAIDQGYHLVGMVLAGIILSY